MNNGLLVWEAFAPTDDVPYSEVIPTNDDRPHTFGPACSCHPFWDENALVHNSFDGREAYEVGARMKS
ncbi:hypothetical protein [Acetobacter sicerae]|uniref:hypothetical protein n=1 Tax=Acetobacter sicerae TaxID=85325 RepID=UPI00156AD007|nr:hypothetical protein [Acetobacter sicerae]NHN93626.1 hypothetical protein [Acetobacter sicerae]